MADEASRNNPNSPETHERMEYLRQALDDTQPCDPQSPSANVDPQGGPSTNMEPRDSQSNSASDGPHLDNTEEEATHDGEFDVQDYMDLLQTPPGHDDSDTDSQESVSPPNMDQLSQPVIGEAETSLTPGLSDDLFGDGNMVNDIDEEGPTDNSDPSQTLLLPTAIPIDPALEEDANQPPQSQPLATGASTTTDGPQSVQLRFPVPVPRTASVSEQIPQAPLQTSPQLQFPMPVHQTVPVSEQVPQAPLQTSAADVADLVLFNFDEPMDGDEISVPHPPNDIAPDSSGEQPPTQPYSLPSSGDGFFASVKHGIPGLSRYSYPPIQWFSAQEWASTIFDDEPQDQIAEDTADYPNYPRPDAWGPGACTQPGPSLRPQSRPLFRYSSRGQWSTETYFTSEELRYYVGMCPRDLKIWVQAVPHKHDRQDEWDMICRWDSCPHKGAIIKPGFLRCSFDEYPHATSNGLRDPFATAGCMHLYCFEKVFDVAKLYRRKRLSPDTRKFPREWGRKNPMALNRLYPDKDIIRLAFEPWIQSRPDLNKIAAGWWTAVPHEETLGYALTLHHCKSSSKRAHVEFQTQGRSGESGGRVLSMEEHLGDLVKWLRSTLEDKEKRQTAQPRCADPSGEVGVPYEQAVEHSFPTVPSLQRMCEDSTAQLSNQESSNEVPEPKEQCEYDEDGVAESEERCNIEAFCAYRKQGDQAEFLIKWVGCTERSWKAADELAEELTSEDLMDLVQPLIDSLSRCSCSSDKKRKRRHDEDEDSDDCLSRSSGSSGYSDKRRKQSHDKGEYSDDGLSRCSGSSISSGKKRKQRHDEDEDGDNSNAVNGRENTKRSRKKSCTAKPTTHAGSKRNSRGDYSEDEPISPSKQVSREQPRRGSAQVVAGTCDSDNDTGSAVHTELHQADTQAPGSVDISSPDLTPAPENPINMDPSHQATTNPGRGKGQKDKIRAKTRHDGVKKSSRQQRRRRYEALLRGKQ
ncbi:hypothetical protein LIA77_04975 [Sarocladium implicatum]|nr:hypothetical protein LIA77_04975 [Sarocladium implicatum]